jgi:hypothetical protein
MAYRRARPAPQPVEVEVRENSWHSGFWWDPWSHSNGATHVSPLFCL